MSSSGNSPNSKLVWSDDPKDKAKLDAEASKKAPEATNEFVKSFNWVAVFRLEKSGRG